MKYTVALVWLVAATSVGAQVQSSFVPQALDKSVNTSYDEINPVLSPDGNTLFFSRVNHPENKYGHRNSEDIWYVTAQADGSWSTATRLQTLNIGRYNAVLGISADGKTMLINGIYNHRGNFWKKRGLSISTKIGDNWSRPSSVHVKGLSRKNKGQRSTATLSADGKFVVMSFSKRWNSKKTNLYVATKHGDHFRKPKKIRALNSKRNEEAPFLSVDNQTVYFSSDRISKGDFDIYKSTRAKNSWSTWSQPVLLSDTINSSAWDSYFKTNAKGSFAYFSSTREAANGADIFKVKVFEENPFVIVSGEIRNSLSKKLLTKRDFSLLVNGKKESSATFNADSGTYKVKLPLRKKYTLAVSLPNFTPVVDSLDVSAVREFTKMRKPLKAAPLPYVKVQGKLLVKNTTDAIPASARPSITVDGIPSAEVQVNAQTGTYTAQLKYGAVYTMQVNANRFEPSPEVLNLTNIDEYQELTFNLFADPEKMATVVGNVLDKKTGMRMAKLQQVRIAVEGLDTVRARVDSSGRYELRLPLGKAYVISAEAPNYYPVYENIDAVQSTGDVTFTKDLVIVPIEVGQSIRLNNIFFDPGKSVLKSESFQELDRVAEFLQSNGAIKVEIAGHTDNVGKAATNQKLSQARAKAVADYVIKKGIDSGRIRAKGYGADKPVESNKTKEGQAKNRRVEFTILDIEE